MRAVVGRKERRGLPDTLRAKSCRRQTEEKTADSQPKIRQRKPGRTKGRVGRGSRWRVGCGSEDIKCQGDVEGLLQ